MKSKHVNSEKIRISRLTSEIGKSFDHLTSDEIEILASGFEISTTRMIEVKKVNPENALVADLFEDIEFSSVIFPGTVLPLLKRHDVFLATLGLKDKSWEIIGMSAPYDKFGA